MCATIRKSLNPPQWMAEELHQLRKLAAARTPARVIAEKLGRPVKGVQKMAQKMGIALAGDTPDEPAGR